MVSFQCDGCGDIIKKPKLKQHQQRCHSSFTCIDCSTTFNGMSYQSHISCITEKQKFQKHLHKQDVVKTEVTKTTEILVKDKPVSLIEQIKATKRKGDSMEEIKVTKRKTESIQESAVMTEEDQLDSCIREILSNGKPKSIKSIRKRVCKELKSSNAKELFENNLKLILKDNIIQMSTRKNE